MAAKEPPNNKKYVVLENYLNSINSKVVSLKDKDISRNNIILNVVTGKIVVQMKQKDTLFAGLYKEKFYGGSYYDGLKVGKPNEFDLDLILHLPAIIKPTVQCSNRPGFVKVEIKEFDKMLLRPEPEKAKFSKLTSLLDGGNFLSTTNVLKWMEGVIYKALMDLPDDGDGKGTYVLSALDASKSDSITKIYAKMFKGGPAFTLGLCGTDVDGSEIKLDIDLVPCFQFNGENWPDRAGGYRPNPSKIKDRFLVVPKKPKANDNSENLPGDISQYWRLSFQEQERELISDNKKVLKPSLKLLKKLRDKHNHKIASYFIKTVFLWTVDKEDVSFWSQPFSVTFICMLRTYEEYMRSGIIPYYWNDAYNLIGDLSPTTKGDIANTLQNIIRKVDLSVDNPLGDIFVIGNYLLSKEELETIKPEIKPTKKQLKQAQFATTSTILLKSQSVDNPDSTTPPLHLLGFEPELVQQHRWYSDNLEVNQQRFLNEIMAQINNGNKGTSNAINGADIVDFLKKFDEKLDKMMDKLDESLVDNRLVNRRVAALEEKVKLLEVENRGLRLRLGEGGNGDANSMDALLDIPRNGRFADVGLDVSSFGLQ